METVRATKRFVLDTLGVALAGTTMPGIPDVARLAARWGGLPEATIWGSTERVPAQNAALVNAAAAHALDFDDVHATSGVHACGPVVAACFAAAEHNGSVNGRRILTALAVGIDVSARLGLAFRGTMHPGLLPTSLFGVFGAAVGGGRAMGLNAAQLKDAFGLAYGQAAGNRQALLDGTLAKRLQPGFAARAGVLSAELASVGISGAREPIHGTFGLNSIFGNGRMDWNPLVERLGDRYEVEELTCKRYPCCSSVIPAIDAVLLLRERHGLRAKDVEAVLIGTTPTSFELVGRPFVIREQPQVDAQFSNAYAVAVALLRGRFELSDVMPGRVLEDDDVHRLARRIVTIVDPKLDVTEQEDQATVEVRTFDGRVLRQEVRAVQEGSKHPLSRNDHSAKFRACAEFARRPLTSDAQDEVISTVEHLEDAESVSEVVSLLR